MATTDPMQPGAITDWRLGVSVTLAEIRTQLNRLVSDRESEKETVRRLETRLQGADNVLTNALDKHAEKDQVMFAEIQRKVFIIVGAALGVQAVAGIILGIVAVWPKK